MSFFFNIPSTEAFVTRVINLAKAMPSTFMKALLNVGVTVRPEMLHDMAPDLRPWGDVGSRGLRR